MIIHRLEPPMVVWVGGVKKRAFFLIDYTQDGDLTWICGDYNTRECWSYKNKDLKFDHNITEGFGGTP